MKNRTKLQKAFIGIASILHFADGRWHVGDAFCRCNGAVRDDESAAAISAGVLFPAAWTVLYVLMGIVCYLLYMSEPKAQQKKSRFIALCFYVGQLFFNLCWNPIFFRLGGITLRLSGCRQCRD